MAALDDTSPLLGDPRISEPQRLNRLLIYGIIAVLGLGTFGLAVLGVSRMMAPPTPPPVVVNEAPGMTTPVQPLEPYVRIPVSFAGLDRRPPLPVAEPLPPPPTAPPPPAPAPPAAAPPAPATKAAETTPPRPPTSTTGTSQPKRPRQAQWLFAKTESHLPKEQHASEKATASQSLIAAATWVRPLDPTRVINRGTVIHGIVLEQVVSDIPGDIKVPIDRPVLDGEGQGRTLIPQNAEAILRQVGEVKYGDKRLGVDLVQIRFRDGTGTLLSFKGAGADKSGATGFTGKVDNRYPQLALGILGTAGLSIGARVAGGNSDSYQPTIHQEFGRDVAGGVNVSGREVLKRELAVNPTITVFAKDQVTIEVLENISLLSDPIVVTK